MTFALTKFRTNAIRHMGTSSKRAIQQVYFEVTGANTDIDLDIGDASGTFWTAVGGSGLGAIALAELDKIADNAAFLRGYSSPQLIGKIQVASGPSAGQFTAATDVMGVNLGFASGDAPTTHNVIFEFELNDNVLPSNVNYGG